MATPLSDREKSLLETDASLYSSTISTSETSTLSSEWSLLQTSSSTKSNSTTYSSHTLESTPTSKSSIASSPQNNIKEFGAKINKKSIDNYREHYCEMRKNAVMHNLAREREESLEEYEEEQNKRQLLLIYFLTWYRALISRHLLSCDQHESEHTSQERRLEANKHICGHVEQVEVHGNIAKNTYNDKEKQENANKYTTSVTKHNNTTSSNNNNNKQMREQTLKGSCEEVSLLADKDIVAEIDKLSPSLQKIVLDIIKSYCLSDYQKIRANKNKDRVKEEEESEKVQRDEENVTREEERKQPANVYRHKHSAKTHFPRTYAVLNEIGEQSLTPCKAIKDELISLLSSLLDNAKTIQINSITALEENAKGSNNKTYQKSEEMKVYNKDVINNKENRGHLCKRALIIPVPESLIENNKVECNEYKRGKLESKHAMNIIDGEGHDKGNVEVDRENNYRNESKLERENVAHDECIDHNTSNPMKTKMYYGASDWEIINEANNAKSSDAFYLTQNPSHTPVLTPVEVHETRGHTLETNNNEMTIEHRFHTSTVRSNERNSERESCADTDLANKVLSLIKTTSGGGVVHDDTTYLLKNDKMEIKSNNVDSCNVGRFRSRVIPSPVVSTDDSETNESRIRELPHREHFLIRECGEYDRKHKLPAYWHVVLQKESQEETNSLLDNQKSVSAHKQHLLHNANHTKYVLCPESEELVTSSEDATQSPHDKHREHRNPHYRKHHRHTRREEKEYERILNADNDNRHQHHTTEHTVSPENNIIHEEHNNNKTENFSGVESATQSSSPIEIVEHNVLLPSNRHDNANQILKQAGKRVHNVATSRRRSNNTTPYYVYDGKRYHSIMPMRRQHMFDQVHGKKRALSSSLPSELALRHGRNCEFSPRQVNTMPLRFGRYNPYCSVCTAKFHYMIMPLSAATTTPQHKSTLKELEKCGSDYFLCENCRMHGADIFATDLVATCCAQTRKSAQYNSTNANTNVTNDNSSDNDDDDENVENESKTENTIYAKERESNKNEQETNNSNSYIKDVHTIANNNNFKKVTNTEITMLRRECRRLSHELQKQKDKLEKNNKNDT